MSEEKDIPGKDKETGQLIKADAPADNKPPPPIDMEVHHHSHGHGHKKTWKSYFWEFLMLFLAVFCGFLAEYKLEHVIEHQREKQYMRSMIKDLAFDTTSLAEGFPRKDERIRAIDSLFDYFSKNPHPNIIPGYLYHLMLRSNWDRSYDRNSVTINQLKNSGNMRLVRKVNAVDSLSSHDNAWERSDFWRQAYRQHQEAISQFVEAIINDYALLTYYKNSASRTPGEDIPADISIEINTVQLLPYLNYLYRQKAFTRQDKANYQRIAAKAGRLIALIKKEYHLE